MHTCRDVFDEFLDDCEMHVTRNELSATTVTDCRNMLNRIWRPHLNDLPFPGVDYVKLTRSANCKKRNAARERITTL